MSAENAKYTVGQRLALALVPPLAALAIRLLGMTLRYEDVGEPGYALSGPAVYAFWHRALLACAYRFRKRDVAVLISPSFDGELVARTVTRLGFTAIRGSSSRGGPAGLRQMHYAYAAGQRCAITADGPRGPMYVAKPGVAALARQVVGSGTEKGTWVGCFHALPVQRWELGSWDRFMIPKPFSRVVISWPPRIPAGAVTTEAVQDSLDRAVAMAEESAMQAAQGTAEPRR